MEKDLSLEENLGHNTIRRDSQENLPLQLWRTFHSVCGRRYELHPQATHCKSLHMPKYQPWHHLRLSARQREFTNHAFSTFHREPGEINKFLGWQQGVQCTRYKQENNTTKKQTATIIFWSLKNKASIKSITEKLAPLENWIKKSCPKVPDQNKVLTSITHSNMQTIISCALVLLEKCCH